MTTTLQFKTNLKCQSCVAAVRPFLEDMPNVNTWEVDTASPEKTLTVEGENLSPEAVTAAVAKAGFEAKRRTVPEPKQQESTQLAAEAMDAPKPVTYYPLFVLVMFLLGVVALVEFRMGTLNGARAMQNFMGAFFLAFAFFKLLDVRGFAESYRMYDVVARRFPAYGYIYPFIELGLGAAYIAGIWPMLVNLTTLVVMSVSSIGVIQSVFQKRQIRCACLGTVFNLPMSTVTLVEDGVMVLMAAAALMKYGQ